MTSDTSIGPDDPSENPLSGIDDEAHANEPRQDGESVMNDDAGHDVTREDIEQGNDQNTSADQPNRSPTTNRIIDDAIQLGN